MMTQCVEQGAPPAPPAPEPALCFLLSSYVALLRQFTKTRSHSQVPAPQPEFEDAEITGKTHHIKFKELKSVTRCNFSCNLQRNSNFWEM